MSKITVTNTSSSASTKGSLAWAVKQAETHDGADTIVFDKSLKGKTITLSNTLVLTQDTTIKGDINGDHKADIIISGDKNKNHHADAGDVQLLQVGAGSTVSLSGLVLKGGYQHQANFTGFASASAILNHGTLSITDSKLIGNVAVGGSAPVSYQPVGYNGGDAATIISTGHLTVTNTEFSANSATGGQGSFGNGGWSDGSQAYAGDGGGNGGNAASAILQLAQNLTLSNVTLGGGTATGGAGGPGGEGGYGGVSYASGDGGLGADGGYAGSIIVAGSISDAPRTASLDTITGGAAGAGGAPGPNYHGGAIGAIGSHGASGAAGQSATIVLLPGATGNVTLIVTNTNDSGAGSLRDAIARADDGATITFAAGLSGKTIYLQSTLELKHGVTIDGDLNNDHIVDITLSGDSDKNGSTDSDVSIMQVDTGAVASIVGVNFSGGHAVPLSEAGNYAPGSFGASAIFNAGTLSIVDAVFSDNEARGGTGGGTPHYGVGTPAGFGGMAATIINSGSLTISHADFHDNLAVGGQGGLGGNGLGLPFQNGFSGSNGGDGGNAAAGILQQSSSGGSLVLDRVTQSHNEADAGNGNYGGNGASGGADPINHFPHSGGNAGNGGDGGNSGFIVATTGTVAGGLSDDHVVATIGYGKAAGGTGAGTYGGAPGIPGSNGNPGQYALVLTIGSATGHVARLVTNTNDSGGGSLRDAIENAENGDTIKFADGLMGKTIVLDSELLLTKSLTIDGDIDGDGKADVTISGDTNHNGISDTGDSRIFEVSNNLNVRLESLTLTNGFADHTTDNGGAIFTRGGSKLYISNTTISDSSAHNGGALYTRGHLYVVNSTFTGNSAAVHGGVLYIGDSQTANIYNTTMAYNSANSGGAISTGSSINLFLRQDTITRNSAASGGGIELFTSGFAFLSNSILSGNHAGTDTNLWKSGSGTTFIADYSVVGNELDNLHPGTKTDDPGLGELLDNGGPVLTLAPLYYSKALDLGVANQTDTGGDLFDLDGDNLTNEMLPTDARGRPRVDGAAPDAGAVERTLNETITGNDRNNGIWEGLGKDTIDGGGGNDSVYYYQETKSVRVTLNGATPADVYIGGTTAAFKQDIIRNIENIVGGQGNDTLTGDGGNNAFAGAAGKDVIDGKGGVDTVDYFDKTTSVKVTLNGSHSAPVYVGGTTASKIEDTVRNIENVSGGSGNDTLTGDGQDNMFRGGNGKDVIDGGDGIDTADYSDKTAGISVTLVKGAGTVVVIGSPTDNDTLKHIENIVGGEGNDTITGDSGNNHIFGGAGTNVLDGGGGSDTVDFSDRTADIYLDLSAQSSLAFDGVPKDTISNFENVVGGSGDDFIMGVYLQANALAGGAGNDTLFGRGAAAPVKGVQQAGDSLYGGDGDDTFYLEANSPLGKNAILSGGAGTDTLYIVGDFSLRSGYVLDLRSAVNLTLSSIEILNMDTTGGEDQLGAVPVDTIKLNAIQLADVTTIQGSIRPEITDVLDIVMGSVTTLDLSTRTITGFHDYDTLTGGSNDTIIITGDSSSEKIIGGNGPLYEIHAGGGNDTIGAGADLSLAGFHADILDGGSGNDWVDYSGSNEQLTISLLDSNVTDGLVVAHLNSIENVIGGNHGNYLIGDDGANVLRGGDENDSIDGGNNNDTLMGGGDNDTLIGGNGNDTADYSDQTTAVTIALYNHDAGTGYVDVFIDNALADELLSIENLIGGSADDGLYGDELANRLSGGVGNDTLGGGAGNDTLDGGAGADQYYFFGTIGPGDVDHISKFEQGSDKVMLSNSTFALGPAPDSSVFLSLAKGHAAANSQQHLIYDRSTGELWYDSNGSGSGGATKFAIIDNHSSKLSLHWSDFHII